MSGKVTEKMAVIMEMVFIHLPQSRYTCLLVFCHTLIKGKVFPYSLPSVGPGADPGVQAVSPQVTWSDNNNNNNNDRLTAFDPGQPG